MTDLKRPSPLNTARESLAWIDALSAPAAMLASTLKPSNQRFEHPVIVLPGFGTHDVSTVPLRYFLRRQGFDARGWGLGFNFAGRDLKPSFEDLSDRWSFDRTRTNNGEAEVPALIDKMTEVIAELYETEKKPVHLVGWSLGGLVAREVARDLPEAVLSIVTMGSPVLGGPKYSAVAQLFSLRNMDLDWIEDEINNRARAKMITQPITLIFSKRDGIVGWKAQQDTINPDVTPIEVNVSHLGLGVNAKVWRLVKEALVRVETQV